MTHGSLFNGIGGFQLAAAWMNWDNVFSCEIDKFCNKVTKYHFPNCIQHEDIRTTDFGIYRGKIDIITGGFPCQPFSQAGKRKGTEDNRHLWPQMLRAIQEIQPRWIVGENVLGLLNWNRGMVFDKVCADLEGQGYYNTITPKGERKVVPVILPACGVNAPHQRYRIWFVAHTSDNRTGASRNSCTDERGEPSAIYAAEQSGDAAAVFNSGLCDIPEVTADTDSERSGNKPAQPGTDSTGQYANDAEQVCNATGNTECGAANANASGLPKRLQPSEWQNRGTNGKYQGSEFTRNYPKEDWSEFPTQSPVCNRNDGIPRKLDGITFSKWRIESIKALGNAIVPQVALQIFKAIEQHEKL